VTESLDRTGDRHSIAEGGGHVVIDLPGCKDLRCVGERDAEVLGEQAARAVSSYVKYTALLT